MVLREEIGEGEIGVFIGVEDGGEENEIPG